MSGDVSPLRPADRISISCVRGPFVAPVFGRAVGALAARADFPIDRIQDCLLLIDAVLAACDELVTGGRVTITADTTDGGIELRLGPLRPGGAHRLLGESAFAGVGEMIRRITAGATVRKGAAGAEFLVLEILSSGGEPRRAGEKPGAARPGPRRLRRV